LNLRKTSWTVQFTPSS